MAHLRRLSIWSSSLRNMYSGAFYWPPTKYSVTSCKVLDPFSAKERLGYRSLCACMKSSIRQFSLTNCVYIKKRNSKEKRLPIDNDDNIVDVDIDETLLEDPCFESIRKDSKILGFIGSESRASEHVGALVLQPWIKWGHSKRTDTSAQLLLGEAVALVGTLPGVQVVAQEVVPVKSLDGKVIFGTGTLERLVSQVRASRAITCVFISVDMLKKVQIIALEETFGKKVLDRYSVVLGIFRHHARTKEARLQVALAELPYIRKRVSNERERLVIIEREKHLKAALDKLAGVRALIRNRRVKNNLPTVAVVGYTNSGKTSLIYAITKDMRAEGKDQLFATLDVTAHGGRLPCGLEVLFIDTVGFIQDIPTDLVASFKATLEDAVCSDVVVHVRDASHPDYELQGKTVTQTLASLPLPEETPVIMVANKVDMEIAVTREKLEGAHLVSALKEQGIEDLLYDVEKEVLRVTGRKIWKFSLPTGSQEIQWLRSVTGLAHEEMDEGDPQTTHVLAVLTAQELSLFHRNFRKQR